MAAAFVPEAVVRCVAVNDEPLSVPWPRQPIEKRVRKKPAPENHGKCGQHHFLGAQLKITFKERILVTAMETMEIRGSSARQARGCNACAGSRIIFAVKMRGWVNIKNKKF